MTVTTQRAPDGTNQPQADSGHDYSMPTPNAKTGADFCLGLIGPATLSVAASQIAVDKATDRETQDFANFELREAIAVTGILDEMDISIPQMSADGESLLDTLRSTPAGTSFDRIYVAAELANHEFLRDLAQTYLQNSVRNTSVEETHARHLASLAITAFKEHVVLTKNILERLGA